MRWALAGAAVAALIAVSHKFGMAMNIGAPLPGGRTFDGVDAALAVWFDALDLGAAYLLMAWLGWKLAARIGGGGEALTAGHRT